MDFNELKKMKSSLISKYVEFKEKNTDAIVFMQVGEFFEIYCDDAEYSSTNLDLKLTKRTVEGIDIPMCGIPANSGEDMANKLASLGKIVSIIKQKKEGDNVVRYLYRTITPASIDDDTYVDKNDQQIMMCLYSMKDNLGCAMVDYTSGEVITTLVRKYNIFDLIQRYNPKEVYLYLPMKWEEEFIAKIKNLACVSVFEVPYFYNEMKTVIDKHKEEVFKDEQVHYCVIAAHYFMMERIKNVSSNMVTLRRVRNISERDYLYLHSSALTGLEVLENSQTKKADKCLYSLLNETSTAKGSRLLKKWLQEPLMNVDAINLRYAFVNFFNNNQSLRDEIRELLSQTHDIERVLARIENHRNKDFELVSFKNSLSIYSTVLDKLSKCKEIGRFATKSNSLYASLISIITYLNECIDDDLIIKKGYSKEFDTIRDSKVNGKSNIEDYFAKIKAETGIKNIKLEENKVLGYFISVTKSNLNDVPDYFIERASVSTGKRFVTEELKELEEKYILASEEYLPLYKETLYKIVKGMEPFYSTIRNVLDFISIIDVLIGFSVVAEKNYFQKPDLRNDGSIVIENGKHPLLNRYSYTKTVGNNCLLSSNSMQVITGPNMGGKSTYLKMVASLMIMAQVGSYVPAKMSFTPVDRILVRIGASDYMLNNQSTFMMEMEETSYILYHATENSLIILDELGRGTSTNDGIAIAKSVLEYINDNIKAKVICSTHYHELVDFADNFSNMTNYHAEVVEGEEDLDFTFKIRKGGTSKSFGILVAKKAGLPEEVINKANVYIV